MGKAKTSLERARVDLCLSQLADGRIIYFLADTDVMLVAIVCREKKRGFKLNRIFLRRLWLY
jgi:hypothetical protein